MMEKNSTLEDTDNEEYILKLKPNYCVFSAFFIDPFLVLMGFLLTFVSYSLYTWWSMILALILFVISSNSVDFPLPLAPTIDLISPLFSDKLKLL